MINMLLKRLLQAGFVAWAVGSLTYLMLSDIMPQGLFRRHDPVLPSEEGNECK